MQRSLPLQGELAAPRSPPRLALAAKGFRPFFLLAALFAASIMPIWALVFTGVVGAVDYLEPASWHAHEMVFGYAVAVVAGFLLTAVGNWTQRETLVGGPLLALSALWVLGRVCMLLAGLLPRWLVAVVDMAFLPALIIALARPLVATGNRRNFVMLAVLTALCAANAFVHLQALGLAPAGTARHACLVGIDVVVFVILIIAGRVFPMFTRNATGIESIRSHSSLDVLSIAAMAVLTVLDVAVPQWRVTSACSGVVGVLAIARAARWGTRHTLGHPLLWILHLGYAWVVVGLLARGATALVPAIPSSLATHALTVGAIGSLTLGMMARVALGHTGRLLAVPRPVAWAFGAISAAAVARVVVPLLVPRWSVPALIAAATLWTVAFSLYAFSYAPLLVAPRADGKPG
jgi:uncharacterized protein involved in response to NO